MFEAHPPKLGSWSEPNNQKLFQSPHMVPCWKLKAAMSFLHLSVASSEDFTVDIGFVTGASFVIFCFSLMLKPWCWCPEADALMLMHWCGCTDENIESCTIYSRALSSTYIRWILPKLFTILMILWFFHASQEISSLYILSTLFMITIRVGGAADQWEIPKVKNLMGALWIPISLVLGCSEQFSESS